MTTLDCTGVILLRGTILELCKFYWAGFFDVKTKGLFIHFLIVIEKAKETAHDFIQGGRRSNPESQVERISRYLSNRLDYMCISHARAKSVPPSLCPCSLCWCPFCLSSNLIFGLSLASSGTSPPFQSISWDSELSRQPPSWEVLASLHLFICQMGIITEATSKGSFKHYIARSAFTQHWLPHFLTPLFKCVLLTDTAFFHDV